MALPAGAPIVLMTSRGVNVEEARVAELSPDLFGFVPSTRREERGNLIVGIRDALEDVRRRANGSDALVLAFDEHALFEPVIQTIHSAARAGFGRPYLATTDGTYVTGFPIAPPRDAGTGTTARPFLVVDFGDVYITTAGGPIAQGCTAIGDGVTVPAARTPKAQFPDVGAIERCAARLATDGRIARSDEVAVTVSGRTSSFRDVVKVIDALRPTFPRVRLEFRRESEWTEEERQRAR